MFGGISGKATNKLTDLKVRSFIRKRQAGTERRTKLADGGGLYLTLTPAGTPVWRMKYRHGGKERTYSIGAFQDYSLEAARAERQVVKAWLREGREPVQARKVQRAAATEASGHTFATVARDWLDKQHKGWSAIHHKKSSQAFERDVLPRLGELPISQITAAMVFGVVEAIEKRGARETAARVLQHISGVFRLAQARGLRLDNPAEPAREALTRRKRNEPQGRRPSLVTWPELGDVLRRAEAARLSPAVRMAHRLCAFTAVRISNIVEAEWQEFDLESEVPIWVVPRRKMKSKGKHHDHKVFLCPKIVEELKGWRGTVGGKGYAFPSPFSDRRAGKSHITRESIEKAYRVTLGFNGKHSPHSWRAALSTLARDHGFERDVVELALDHIHDNEVVRAYDRGERLDQRINLMNWWGEHLAQAQRGADVVPMVKGTEAA